MHGAKVSCDRNTKASVRAVRTAPVRAHSRDLRTAQEPVRSSRDAKSFKRSDPVWGDKRQASGADRLLAPSPVRLRGARIPRCRGC
eukprot:15447359-Alexandrium_andersonii.AAC.1